MALTFVAVASAASSGAVTTLAVAVPTGTADGDLMVLGYLKDDNATVVPVTLAGWHQIGTDSTWTYFWRVAASEPADYSPTTTTARHAVAWIITLRGANNASPIAAYTFGGPVTGLTPAVPALTLPVLGDYMIIAGIEADRGDVTFTAPAGYTLAAQPDTGGSSSANTAGAAAYKAVVGVSSVASASFGVDASSGAQVTHLAIRAAAVVVDEAGGVIDWDNDGFDIGAFDVVSDDIESWTISRGASAEITGSASPGSMRLTLNNPSDDRYNPQNASGPLYGSLVDGVPVWLAVNSDGRLTGTDPRGLFGGRIADITPIPSPGATYCPKVEIMCEDALGWYGRTPVTLDYSTTRSQRALRQEVLLAAGEDVDRLALASEIHTMPLSAADGNALAVLEAINRANGSRHFAKPADTSADWFAYTTRNRQWRLDGTTDASLSVQDDHVTGSGGWRLSADTVTNQQRATVTPIAFTPSTFEVWRADTLPILVTTSRPWESWVDFDDYVASPTVDANYSGATPTITITPFGDRAKIRITVASGTCTFTNLSVEGALARRAPSVSWVADDTDSQALPRGVRAGGDISNEYVGILASARGIAEHVVWRYATPQLRPTLTVENWFPEMFELDLYDVISVTSPQLSMTARHFEIVGLTLEGRMAAEAAVHHIATYVLQECAVQSDPGWFVLDTSELDSADLLAY